MLVLSRKLDQSIQIGDEITITIVSVKGNTVRLGISAPDHIRVARTELQARMSQALEAPEIRPQAAAASDKLDGLKFDGGVAGSVPRLPNSAWPADSVSPLVLEVQTNPNRPISFGVSAEKRESTNQRPLAGRIGRQALRTDGKSAVEPPNLEELFPAGGYQIFQTRVHQPDAGPIDLADTNCP